MAPITKQLIPFLPDWLINCQQKHKDFTRFSTQNQGERMVSGHGMQQRALRAASTLSHQATPVVVREDGDAATVLQDPMYPQARPCCDLVVLRSRMPRNGQHHLWVGKPIYNYIPSWRRLTFRVEDGWIVDDVDTDRWTSPLTGFLHGWSRGWSPLPHQCWLVVSTCYYLSDIQYWQVVGYIQRWFVGVCNFDSRQVTIIILHHFGLCHHFWFGMDSSNNPLLVVVRYWCPGPKIVALFAEWLAGCFCFW